MALKKNNVLKLSTLILAMLLFFSLFNFYKVTANFDNFKEKSSEENKLKQSQLDEILFKYDSLKIKSSYNTSSNADDLARIDTNILENKNYNVVNSDEKTINTQIRILKTIIDSDSKELDLLSKKISSNKKTLNNLHAGLIGIHYNKCGSGQRKVIFLHKVLRRSKICLAVVRALIVILLGL